MTDDTTQRMLVEIETAAEVVALRAKLAEVEGALREAMATIPSQWGPPDVLAHLLRRAGERDQAVIRAEASEAACAEMRAAGDRLHDDLVLYHPQADVIPAWNALRARTDLGRGMVAVPLGLLERVRYCLRRDSYDSSPDGMKVCRALDALLYDGKATS